MMGAVAREARRQAAAWMAAGLLLCLAAAPSLAQARKSYTFLGLEWGSSIEDVRAKLAAAGFRLASRPLDGPQPEFVVAGLQAALTTVDRGLRLVANGRFAGQPVRVDLSFGKDERLHHVIVTSQYWDGTIPGARALVDLSTRMVMFYEERYGAALKRKDDGWIDTALWPRAADGSVMAIYVRGVDGFMFSPSYKTALRADFVGGKVAAATKIELPPEPDKEPPKPKPLTKQQLRKEYERDPSAVEPPPPPKR
ncbi:MAG: hypothetical protein KIT16_07230 [Rhodospirillaceae bacterium]|nr:hypothetical protein [Rhodospirillaceae bacterium]